MSRSSNALRLGRSAFVMFDGAEVRAWGCTCPALVGRSDATCAILRVVLWSAVQRDVTHTWCRGCGANCPATARLGRRLCHWQSMGWLCRVHGEDVGAVAMPTVDECGQACPNKQTRWRTAGVPRQRQNRLICHPDTQTSRCETARREFVGLPLMFSDCPLGFSRIYPTHSTQALCCNGKQPTEMAAFISSQWLYR